MFKILLSACLIFPVCCGAGEIDKLIDKLEQIESEGNVKAIGDKGNAVGILQIHPIMVREVNRLTGKNYKLSDRLSRKKSREMALAFLENQRKIYTRNQNKAPSMEDLGVSWNTGSITKNNPNYRRKLQCKK